MEWRPVFSLGQRWHFQEDQAMSCQSPRTESTMQAEHSTPKAVSTNPSGSLQGSGTHGWKNPTAVQPPCWLPRTWESEPRLGPLPRLEGTLLAHTWWWGIASASHSGQHQKRLRSRTSMCACRMRQGKDLPRSRYALLTLHTKSNSFPFCVWEA